MNHILKYYKPILTVIVAGLVVFGVGIQAWAADWWVCNSTQAIEQVGEFAYLTSIVIHLMSWAWSIVAIVAGELMSNDLIYGEIVGLGHYFYQFWTLMRTIANFALVGIIVTIIAKVALNKIKAHEVFRLYGVKLILAGVLINASWFLMGLFVDLSTVMIAGVGQIWSQFMDTTIWDKQYIESFIKSIPDKIVVNECGCIEKTNTTGSKSSKTRDSLIANRNTLTGPLIFLGAGVMKFHAYDMSNIWCQTDIMWDIGQITLRWLLQMFLMIMFILPLIVLAAFNLFRLLYIWWWIMFSPIIVLINLFKDETEGYVWPTLKKAISRETIIKWLIQPVFTVWALVIGLMFVMGMYQALDFTKTETLNSSLISKELEWVINKDGSSEINIGNDGNLGSIKLVDKLINDPTATIGGGFWYLLISFATCFVLWMLVRFSFTLNSWVGSMMWFDPEKLMGSLRGEFMKRVKLPRLLWWPLWWASLNEATSLFDPADKNNRIMKKIENVSTSMKKAGIDKANTWLENSWAGKFLGMQDNGDISTSDEEKLVQFTKVNMSDTSYASNLTSSIIWMRTIARDQKTKKTFKIDRTDRKSYKQMEKWYKDMGKDALTSIMKNMWLKVKDKDWKDTDKFLEPWSFEEEFKKGPSYLWWLIEYIAKWWDIKVSDWKDIKIKISEKRISDIDFKSFNNY